MMTGPRRQIQKIDDRVLVRLIVKDGKNQADCARHFGVSETAISKRVRALGLDGFRQPTAAESHLEAASRGAFDLAQRVSELDGLLQEELSKLRGATVPLAEPQRFDRLITLVSESRKTVGTAIELSRAMAAMQQMAEFREHVMAAVDELDTEFPALKTRLLERLRDRATLRRALTVDGASA